MKKFTALITMAICLIIGGVYATWNYAKSDLITGSKVLDGVTTITAAVEEGSKGKIEVDVSGFKIEIDDADNDHIGECTVSGEVIVLFTPPAQAHTKTSKRAKSTSLGRFLLLILIGSGKP